LKRASHKFGHHAVHELPSTQAAPNGIRLYDSYHCSRYNTQTRRLTADMFRAVLQRAVVLAG
jgi:uracil-DNA glycosylase